MNNIERYEKLAAAIKTIDAKRSATIHTLNRTYYYNALKNIYKNKIVISGNKYGLTAKLKNK